MEKIRVGILFGGKSSEHEVSLLSAKSVIDALPREKYIPVLIGIDKQGKWCYLEEDHALDHADDPRAITMVPSENRIMIDSGPTKNHLVGSHSGTNEIEDKIDVIFPVLHGTYGEDGTVQGLLKLTDIPFVGPGVLGSAVGMDKDVCKRLLREAGVCVADWVVLRSHEIADLDAITEKLGYPVFVKPANAGSSVGVNKAKDKQSLATAIQAAFRYDSKILVESAIVGREIECAVLGNIENMEASVAGEVIPNHEFYSYEAKYLDENGAGLVIPAEVTSAEQERIQSTAIRACATLECEGMSRVDFFLTPAGEVILNEINTIPGFTKISMYPKLWEATGLPYPKLIDRLLTLAILRHQREQKLLHTR